MFKDLYKHRELLLILVQRNIKIRYKNSALGFFWTLLGPIFLICIYAIFLHLMRFNINLPSLVTGIITWQFFAMCMGDSLHAIMGNASLVTKASFPRIILPSAMVLANTVNFLLSILVLLIYLLIVKTCFGVMILLPLIIMTQFALCLGLALIVSSMNVFFRDTEHVLSTIMLAWFFLTPVIYGIGDVMPRATELLGPSAYYLFFANPMTGILTAYRSVFLSEGFPGIHLIALSFGVSWIICLIGVVVFQKVQVRFGDEL
ncbi:MAG: ABC transporter permease [Kiritimatiellae bacterium]|nr:ABC transporter permease [Kiritimatiellia bacterium]MDD5521250.1 ABC transporter permease [Kiritimatiellia bacterium]